MLPSLVRDLYSFLIESVNIVFWGLRGSSVAQDYLDCCAVCATRFVNLPRSAPVFSFLIKKQYYCRAARWRSMAPMAAEMARAMSSLDMDGWGADWRAACSGA